jgi:translation initiation factor 2 beta subunit (eIF-2beta)/eIF-5
VNKHLEYIQGNYTGDMKKNMSLELSEYRSIRKLIPELGNKREEIINNLTISRSQITDLKKAISENATHDAVGNEMNDAYYKKIIAQEIKANKDLVTKMEFVISRTDSVFNRYNRHYTQVKYWVDSLRSSEVRIRP